MSSNKAMDLLTFEWDSKNEILEMHTNKKGLENLKSIIDKLLITNENYHVHLMTKQWGGNDLSDEKQSSENELINHVKLFKWDGNKF